MFVNYTVAIKLNTQLQCTWFLTGPSAPEILNVTTNSSTSLILSWSRPTHFFRQVSRYLIVLDKLQTGEVSSEVVDANGQMVQEVIQLC